MWADNGHKPVQDLLGLIVSLIIIAALRMVTLMNVTLRLKIAHSLQWYG